MLIKRLILLDPAPPKDGGGAPPAAPVAPVPAATPPTPDAGSDNPFSEIDAKFKAADGLPTPSEPKPGEPPKPAAGQPPKPAPKSPEPAKGEPKTPPELRADRERLIKELETHKTSTAALEAKIKDFEAKGKDAEALRGRLESVEKEYAKTQGELRALKREATPEFKEKYDVPFNRAAKFAENMLQGMTKADNTPADFQKDFVPLYRMPYNAAYARARELFGDEAAPAIMAQVGKLQELDFTRREAMEEERVNWEKKQKEEEGKIVQQREQFQSLWEKVNTDLQTNDDGYKFAVDDKELQDLQKQGYQIFDAEAKSPQQLLVKNAHIRQRAAAYAPLRLLVQRHTARLAALEAQLAKYKPKQPNDTPRTPATPAPGGEPEDWATGARAAMEAAV